MIDFVFVTMNPGFVSFNASSQGVTRSTGSDPAHTPEERLTILERLRTDFPEAKFQFRREF